MAVSAAYGTFFLIGRDTALPSAQQFPLTAILIGMVQVAGIYFQDLYTPERPRTRSAIVAAFVGLGFTLGACFAVAQLVSPTLALGRRFYLTYLLTSTAALVSWRLVIHTAMLTRGRLGVMVLGLGEAGPIIADEVRRREHLGYRLLGFVESARFSRSTLAAPSGEKHFVVSSLNELKVTSPITAMVVPDRGNLGFSSAELLTWRMRGVEVIDFESFYERLTGKLPVMLLRENWLAFAPGFTRSPGLLRVKRVLDVVATVVLGAIGLLPALIVAVAIKLDSEGPVLYRQERVGKDGKTFRLYKFRSMREDAEDGVGAVWAKNADHRVTRVGRVIRKLRIDELPQLYNVLKGEMSLVGPRPERPQLVVKLAEELPLYDYRHMVRPGITGWAQVCFRYGASVDDALQKLCYDLYYVKNWSLLLDVQIMLQTIKVIIFGRGAR